MTKAAETISQTTAQTAKESIEFPSFDANQATDQIRAIAEKSVEQSKEAYGRLKGGAETAQKALEASLENAKSVSSELSTKSLAALRTNAELSFDHVESLLGVRSISEFVELQSSFVRRQFELAINQARDFQTLSSKGLEDVARPVKDVVEKAWSELKVA